MFGRPPTSSGRPPSSGRPTTSRPSTAAYFDRDPQYTYSQDYDDIDEEDEESEAEDVFAFGPPPTAPYPGEDPEQAQIMTSSFAFASGGANLVPASLVSPQLVSPSLTSPLISPSVSVPPQAFNPNAHTHPTAGPSSLFSRHPYPHPLSPVDTPPSTESNPQDDDQYRMRRLAGTGSTQTTGTGRLSGLSSAISSREVHVSLPKDKERQARYKGKGRTPSTPGGSVSIPSVLDLDSQEGSIKMEFDLDELEEEDSPYPEVRASVSNIDDPEMPSMTIRMWCISLLLSLIAGSANTFFSFRQPSPYISPPVLLLLSHPVGKFLAMTLPISTYRLPKWLGGWEFSLNPGPWNIKEHALVFLMANITVQSPFALTAIVVAELDYNIHYSWWFSLLLILTTQLSGFGLAGLCRRFLIWPASMVWPQNLVTCTVLNTLHAEEDEDRGGVTRYRFFIWATIGAFFWFFLPGYLFTGLSIFSWVCWISPDNIPVNQLFGVVSGLGMGMFTFDWTEISWIGSPLMIPWWAEVQIFAGFVILYWIITPALYYSNVWELAHFPMMVDVPYDRYGQPYDVSRIMNADHSFNLQAYDDYSPLYLPAAYAMTYLIAFGLSACLLVHTALYHGRTLLNGFQNIRIEKDDIHAKLMRAYPEVPDWWYITTFCVFFSLCIVCVEVWHTDVPIWALLLALILPLTYLLPAGYIYAMTGQVIAINLLAQIIPGLVLPGKPLANMIMKSVSVQMLIVSTNVVADLKLGHYVKIPPRGTFLVQLVGGLIVSVVQVAVKEWMFRNIPDICAPNQKDRLTCPRNPVFFTASAVWGLIGPTRQFGAGSVYHVQLYAIAIGALLPLPFWLMQKRYPNSWNKYISIPVLLNGVSLIPPATGINYSSFFVVALIFQFIIRRQNFAWWSKFNYIFSAAMDSGTGFSIIFIFFALQFPKDGTISVDWWGNTVWQRTADAQNLPLRSTPSTGL